MTNVMSELSIFIMNFNIIFFNVDIQNSNKVMNKYFQLNNDIF